MSGTHKRIQILDGDGNPWVSPTPPSSDSDDTNLPEEEDDDDDVEMPMFDDSANYDIEETNDMDTDIFSEHDMMINDEQHVSAPDKNPSMTTTTLSHEVDMEGEADLSGACHPFSISIHCTGSKKQPNRDAKTTRKT